MERPQLVFADASESANGIPAPLALFNGVQGLLFDVYSFTLARLINSSDNKRAW